MSTRTPQAGDIIRHADEEGRFGFQYYGEGTVKSASGGTMSVYFPKRGANYTFRTDDPSLQVREPEAAIPAVPAVPRQPEARKPATAQPGRKPGKATDKQVKYAMSLLKGDGYDDEVFGPGDDAKTRQSLERMTSAEISSLISRLSKRA